MGFWEVSSNMYGYTILIKRYKDALKRITFRLGRTTRKSYKFSACAVILKMLNSYKSSLQLNSYKLDSHGFQQKLAHLTQQNHELKATIHSLKLKENQLLQQLNNAKQESHSLRLKIQNQSPVKVQTRCYRCEEKDILLEQGKQRAQQYKDMYQNQAQNKKNSIQFYENKMHGLLKDKDALVNKYEEKIRGISLQNIQNLSSRQSNASITSIGQLAPATHRSPPLSPRLAQPVQGKKPLTNSRQTQNNHRKVELTDKESSIDKVLRPCLERMQKMNLSIAQLKYIQQIERFSQKQPVSKNRYKKLLNEFPFACDNQQAIQSSFVQLETELTNQGKEITGSNVMEAILRRLKALQ